jgi:hypothetical protein
MTVLSKMYYDSPSGWIEGGTTGVGDFHCWIEDGNGKVIYDPYFGEYEFICKIQHCDVKSPVYKIWPNQMKWLNEKKPQRIWLLPEFVEKPQYSYCNYNCWAYMTNKYGKQFTPELVQRHMKIGSLGWRYPGRCDAHWEYG